MIIDSFGPGLRLEKEDKFFWVNPEMKQMSQDFETLDLAFAALRSHKIRWVLCKPRSPASVPAPAA